MTFYELEKKCKERRLKKFLIIFSFFLLVIVGGYFVYSYFINSDKKYNSSKKLNHSKYSEDYLLDDEDDYIFSYKKEQKDKSIVSTSSQSITLKKEKDNKNINEVNKDIDVIKKEKIPNNSIQNKKFINSKKENNISQNVVNKNEIEIKKVKKEEIKKEPKEVVLKPIVPFNNINHTENKKIVEKKESKKEKMPHIKNEEKVIISADKLPPYNLCIKLAKKYLLEGKYKLALKWAKNANIQNNEAPEPWIITAKALYFEGKVDKAKEILKIYLKYNKNREVERILKEMEEDE